MNKSTFWYIIKKLTYTARAILTLETINSRKGLNAHLFIYNFIFKQYEKDFHECFVLSPSM